MAVSIEINGINYTGFTSVNVTKEIDTISGKFSINSVFRAGDKFTILRGDRVVVKVNDTPIINGYVESISANYTYDSTSITVRGRDKTCDVIDSQIDGDVEFNTPLSLTRIIEKTLERINIQDVNVINEVSDLEPFTESDLISGQVGQTAFEFLESHARKRQVLLSTNGNGDIVITRASGETINASLRHRFNGNDNNILEARAEYSMSSRFNIYRCKSQGNTSGLNELSIRQSEEESESVEETNINSDAIDDEIRDSRILTFIAENASDSRQARQRARWEANVRRARSLKYLVTVQGDSYDGTNPWPVNRLVQVLDDYADVSASLLIERVEFSFDLDQGTLTSLSLVPQDAYTPEPVLPEPTEEVNPTGTKYILEGINGN
jgi:prophage tail gpP-like protein